MDRIERPGWQSRLTHLRGPGGIRATLDPVAEASLRAEVRELSLAELDEEFQHARVSGTSTKRQWADARKVRNILAAEIERRGLPRPQQDQGGVRGRYVAGNMPTPLGPDARRVSNED